MSTGKKKSSTIGILASLSICIIVSLYLLSDKINHRSNNFVRIFPPHVAARTKVFDIGYNSYYIAGITLSRIYLGNETNPKHLLIVNMLLNDTQHITISYPDIFDTKACQLFIDSPHFYSADFIKFKIYTGKTSDFKARILKYDETNFSGIIPIDTDAFVIRTLNSDIHAYILAKYANFAHGLITAPGILEMQGDGLFSVDGMLNYDPTGKKVVYVYYYRNQFICMNNKLNLLFRGKTIDTNQLAKIKVTEIKSQHIFTLDGPPLIVNKRCDVWNNMLFINSGLLATNEIKDNFDNASVIDVYSLKTGIYNFSFYIYDFEGKKIKNFKIFDNNFIAIYDHYLIRYILEPEYFNKNPKK